MNVLESLILLQNSLPEGKHHHHMIRIITANLQKVKNCTIHETAALCHTSATSVSRLCSSLGFDSYITFRTSLADTLENYEFYNHLLPVNFNNTCGNIHKKISEIAQAHCDTLRQLPVESVEKAAEILHSKKSIHFFTHFPVPMIFMSLQENLIMDSKQSYYHLVTGNASGKVPDGIDASCAAMFVMPELHTETPLLNLYRLVHHTGADTIVIFTKPRPYWDNATLKIFLPGNRSLLDAHLSQYFLEMLTCVYRVKYLHPHASDQSEN